MLADLTAQRDVIALDLPGFGHTAPLVGKRSVATLADAVTDFLKAHGLLGIDAVGSSMGARLVLELARRGVVGAVVSLDPGGFQRGWENPFYYPDRDADLRGRALRARPDAQLGYVGG
ncbi:alpha/beta fold hydrolase [Deinococcus ruber]|uniref:AB hydrolase-1 domain-containing protein n=1 Tax=Deinococcus ruber TaxID=1848197 RepID=A0A918KXM1_9DEIO|nr:alpha/beta fold hydrolase [Deinococcus ruber]GGR40712.1 hypothetical protein GCM10008957_56300 [Deinococcus ruber]